MKISIRTKLMLIMISIISINYFMILSFGNTFVETYYQSYKEKELINYGSNIKKAFIADTPYDNTILSGEARNLTFLLFDYKDQKTNIQYFSRPAMKDRTFNANFWISESISNGVFVSLELSPNTLFSMKDKNQLYLYLLLEDKTYLFISTPLDYISTTADLSLQFFSYLSLASLLIGSILIFIMSGLIAKPIIRINKITKKIAQLKFDETCSEKGNDEVADLARNVNIMATQIEQNLNLLIDRNALLLKDLSREEETSEMRRQFIANVSHDFKTPLSLIQAYCEVLKESTNDSATTQTYQIILDQVKQMNSLVNQLLSLSLLESGLVKLEMSFFAINEVIETVLTNMNILLQEHDVQYTFTSDDSYIVSGDYQKVIQVFTNLIENAIKYSPPKDTLHISLKKQLQQVMIEIQNKAPEDFDDENVSLLFNSFYKMDATRNLNQKSYGLGLAIVKAIMELHEQKYGVRLADGNIIFYFTLDISSIMDDDDEDEE